MLKFHLVNGTGMEPVLDMTFDTKIKEIGCVKNIKKNFIFYKIFYKNLITEVEVSLLRAYGRTDTVK